MRIVVIGTGYVGLVSGACLADLGHDVVCVDKDQNKIERLKLGQIPIFEPGLDVVVARTVKQKNLSFTSDLNSSLEGAEAVILAVGTPTAADGSADLTYVFAAAKEVAQNLKNYALIITKSTVPVGTGGKIKKILETTRPELGLEVASNPEFLREGSAVTDFKEPDRIIIGAESQQAKDKMQMIYSKMIGDGTKILFTNVATAELIKYASNAFLAMKIAFVNEIADICEATGANVEMVVKGMGMDARIGNKYMSPGPGYGGSCFPKDTKALTHIAKDSGTATKIIEAVIAANDARKVNMAQKIINAAGGDVRNKTIAILGLAFKANTDDMRDSPSLDIIPILLKAGAKLKCYDPESIMEAKKLLPPTDALIYVDSAATATTDADAAVILTEWQEFLDLDLAELKKLMLGDVIVDLRNIIDGNKAVQHGFRYIRVGSNDTK